MNRLHTFLAAGGLTGLVLATMLALGFAPERQASATAAQSPTATSTVTPGAQTALPDGSTPVDVDALLDQNRQLKEVLERMQRREAQYQEQIERANQALEQMAAASGADCEAYGYDDDHDDDDRDHDDDHDDGHRDDHGDRDDDGEYDDD